ncbi:hypothetical protein POI8812_00141 [Pontivivens insulae]|uniref:Uncharacterized protein n=1 Tax=Pontivivens insulae TaxID=1639689 RepID=A0A2R8A6M2_9RHOB|nr:hypothetical protein POI8812_00141 [Pontivivens insulae]
MVLAEVFDKIPDNLSDRDLYFLLVHSFEHEQIASVAVSRLEQNPLLEAEAFPGDLLQTVLRLSASFWSENFSLWRRVQRILLDLDEAIAGLRDARIAFEACTYERTTP